QEYNNNERKGGLIYPLPAGSGKGQDLLLVRLRAEQEAALLRWLAQGHRILAGGLDRATRPDRLFLWLQAERQGATVRRHPQQPAERRRLRRSPAIPPLTGVPVIASRGCISVKRRVARAAATVS